MWPHKAQMPKLLDLLLVATRLAGQISSWQQTLCIYLGYYTALCTVSIYTTRDLQWRHASHHLSNVTLSWIDLDFDHAGLSILSGSGQAKGIWDPPSFCLYSVTPFDG
jgi:hypothetical protein